MSGTRTLVYHQASVEQMRSDLETMRTSLQQQADSVFSDVDGQLTAWSEQTVSRQAEREYQRQLTQSVGTALQGLSTLRDALGQAAELAENAETRNVALMS